ncbi:MAG: TetR/AcrR family transcriptional regulator [Planctomycetia bacterium]|jgi:AcrR family transcriptional regulator
MSKPSKKEQRQSELLPHIVSAFVEKGYQNTTTAELARRCQVQETILYRLWPDKKSMFTHAIDYVGTNTVRIWREALKSLPLGKNSIQTFLEYESNHLGEFGNYRIIFSALSETDDPQIKEALQRMYWQIHTFLVELLVDQGEAPAGNSISIDNLAWSLMGLGTMATILKELGILSDSQKQHLLSEVGSKTLLKNDS